MYREFYGLIRSPFEMTPDPAFLYLGESHQEGLATLVYGVQARKGFVLLTGEVGTGKTTLLHALLAQLDPSTASAFLFNPKRVELVDRTGCGEGTRVDVADGPSLTCSPGLVDPGNPVFAAREDGRGGSRKPLAAEFRFAGRRLFFVNLHLASKGGDDPLFGRRQPPKTPSVDRRNAQTGVVAEFVGALLTRDPKAGVVVLGDLNDFEASEPLATLEEVGLENLVVRMPLDDRYTYVYMGNSQVLDHILVSPSLTGGADVDIVHLNAEFPTADRVSDHDPVIVRLSFVP